jgi:hypothetical protein
LDVIANGLGVLNAENLGEAVVDTAADGVQGRVDGENRNSGADDLVNASRRGVGPDLLEPIPDDGVITQDQVRLKLLRLGHDGLRHIDRQKHVSTFCSGRR